MIQLLWPIKEFLVKPNDFNKNFPVNGGWAYMRNGKKDIHRAFDVTSRNGDTKGAPIICSYDGVVTKITSNYGILVKHVINGKIYWTLYWHCLKIFVKVGDKVKMGQEIGLVGGDPRDNIPDGGITTGPHVHWRFTEGETYDPMKSIDVQKSKDIVMKEYNDLFPNIPDWALDSWKRAVDGGYATKDPNEEIDAKKFQEILVKAGEIKQVGPLPAYRAFVLLDKLRNVI